jgi:hypothetical protein
MLWGSANLVPTSRPERTERVLGSVVPLLLLPDSRSHYTNRSMHSSMSSPVLTLGWDNSCKPKIQVEVITALVRQGDFPSKCRLQACRRTAGRSLTGVCDVINASFREGLFSLLSRCKNS